MRPVKYTGELWSAYFQVDSVFTKGDRNGSEAIGRSGQAPASLDIEFPTVARAFESGASEGAIGERPERVGTLVMEGEDAVAGANHDEPEAIVVDARERVRSEVSERQR